MFWLRKSLTWPCFPFCSSDLSLLSVKASGWALTHFPHSLSGSLIHCNLTFTPFPTPNCSSKVLISTGSFSTLFYLLCPLQHPAGSPNHPVPRRPTCFSGTEHQQGPRERRNRIIGSSTNPTPFSHPYPKEDALLLSRNSFAQGRCGLVQLAVSDPFWSAIILLYGPFNPTFLFKKSQNQVESQASFEQSDLQPHVGASFPRGKQPCHREPSLTGLQAWRWGNQKKILGQKWKISPLATRRKWN